MSSPSPLEFPSLWLIQSLSLCERQRKTSAAIGVGILGSLAVAAESPNLFNASDHDFQRWR